MGAFINLPADPVAYEILECLLKIDLTLEDGLIRHLVNVFHYHKASGSGSPVLSQCLTSFADDVCSPIIAHLNVRCTGAKCELRPLDDPLVISLVTTPATAAGAVTGDPLSASLAAVVSMDTGVRGRSFQGRKHFGGLSESDSDGGDELKASVITSWNAAIVPMTLAIGDGAGFTYNPCVLSSTLSLVGATPPVFTGADVTTVTLNHILGTMRRRKERVPA